MKVAHRDDYDTHAVIGGNEVMEFGIAQTAEFFTVLSNTLYTDKPLAVIREVLCNAWDAHIVSGKQDTPVQITLDDEKLVIRDFGPGIHPNNMHKTYCVYGSSTKENDGNQTGGFGLGSKAPFAYSDHFTVVTYHQNFKTVYAISRGSALTKGKPDIRVMVRVPTTQTGLEVMIPIKMSSDVRTFEKHILQIARLGEMNVTLNDEPIEPMPISKAENNIYLTKEFFSTSYETVFVRYGNVVYPVPYSVEYATNLSRVEKLVQNIKAGSHPNARYRLILQAPANSISVSPSRESLSLSETTVQTIKRLLTEVYLHLDYENQEAFTPILDSIYDKTFNWFFQKMRIMELYTDRAPYQTYGDNRMIGRDEAPKEITNKRDLLFHVLRTQEKISNYTHMMQNLRIAKLLHDDKHPRSFLSKYFLKEYANGWIHNHEREFEKRAFNPLLRGLAKTEALKPKDLLVYSPSHRISEPGVFQHVTEYAVTPQSILAFLKPVIVLTYSRKAFLEDFYTMNVRHIVPKKTPVLVYVVTRSRKGLENAQTFFKKMGFYVVDFASHIAEKEEEIYVSGSIRRTTPISKYEGLPTLHNLVQNGYFRVNGHLKLNPEKVHRSTTYTHVIQADRLSGSDWGKRFFPWGDVMGKDIVKMFGNTMGICTNIKQKNAQIKKGKGDGILHIVETISNLVLTNPRIRTYFELQTKGTKHQNTQVNELLSLGAHSEVLRQVLGLPEPMTNDDWIVVKLYEMLHKKASRYNPDEWERIIRETGKEIDILKESKRWEDIHHKVIESKTFDLLNIDLLSTRLKRAVEENDTKTKTFIEISVINALT